jgi:hypothetical protein
MFFCCFLINSLFVCFPASSLNRRYVDSLDYNNGEGKYSVSVEYLNDIDSYLSHHPEIAMFR